LSASAELLVIFGPVWLGIAYSRPFWVDLIGGIPLGIGYRRKAGVKVLQIELPDGRKF